jgi:hypothetical protein
MAKMFYTMDETKAALSKSEEEIRQLSKDGKLREFRDGPRLMFKADQVEGLKSEISGDQIGLGAGDTHAPLGLADSKTGSGTGVGMNLKGDTTAGVSGLKDDTAAGMDVGLSGSLSGSIGGGSLAGSMGGSLGGSLGGSHTAGAVRGKGGVNVFGEEEHADPMAQTHITPPRDQISLEGVGSGSGLLDLTRETDDTSLGAALLDEITPKSTRSGSGTLPPSSGSTAGLSSISPIELPPEPVNVGAGFAPTASVIEAPDPMAPAFALGSVAASIVVLLAGFVLIGALATDNPLLDSRIPLAKMLDRSLWMLAVGGAVLAVIGFVIGAVLGKAGSRQSA